MVEIILVLAAVGTVALAAAGVAVAERGISTAIAVLGQRRRLSKFKGKWALVTGASEGIGASVAAVLARRGMNVVLLSRTQAKLEAVAKKLRGSYGVETLVIAADVTQPSIAHIVIEALGTREVALLVNNAGGLAPRATAAPFLDWNTADIGITRDLNGTAAYMLTKALAPGMVRRGHGAVVSISSLAATPPSMYIIPYAAEKAKLNAWSYMMALELYETGVTVQSMPLGRVVTPGLQAHHSPANVGGPVRRGLFIPSPDTVAEAIVNNIGAGGPVVVPYWPHTLQLACANLIWPPALQRRILRPVYEEMRRSMQKLE